MAARYVEVLGVQYNKKQFGLKWSGIVDNYEPGISVSAGDRAFLAEICTRIGRFAKILERGRVNFRVVQKIFNGKRVKGIVLVSPSSGYEVWMGKQVVMNALYPRTTLPDPAKLNRKHALKALRSAIEPQIEEYRRRFRGQNVIKSSLSGKPILGAYHVDHVYPFIRLVEEWCRDEGLDLETIPVKCKGVQCRLQSVDMAESWFDYHSLHAEFQILDASENTSKGARYYGKNSSDKS